MIHPVSARSFKEGFSVMTFLLISALSHGQSMFQQLYGGLQSEGARAIIQTSDNGYALVGSTYSFGAGSEDVYLVKTNNAGNIEWTATYGGNDIDIGYSLQQMADGSYLLAGSSRSFGPTQDDAYLLHIDSSGGLNWSQTFPSGGFEYLNSTRLTLDGGVIASGVQSGQACIMKFDASGSIEWSRQYSGNGFTEARAIVPTSDSGYAATGFIVDAGSGKTDFILIRTDAQGDTLWTRRLGGGNYDEAESLQQTADGGFILAGHSDSFSSTGLEMYLVRLDASGNLLWSKVYGLPGNEYASSVVISPTGGYTLLGRSIGVGAGSWDMVLLHTDTSGNLQWEKAYGLSQTEYPYSLIVTNDGGYALSGESFNNGFGQSDLYFVKTDDQGLNGCYTDSSLSENPAATVFYAYAPVVTTGVIPINVVTSAGMGGGASARYCSVGLEEGTQNGLRLYPNPFSDALHLELTTVCKELSITIRNTMGQIIERQNFRNSSAVSLHFEAAPGLYLVETDTGEKGKIQSRVIKY